MNEVWVVLSIEEDSLHCVCKTKETADITMKKLRDEFGDLFYVTKYEVI